LRIGVTGHRVFDDEPRVRAAATRIVAALRDQYGNPLEVWSSLAEGADRIVAEAVLDCDESARLVAVLPVHTDDYRTDFADPASATEFDGLAARATDIRVAGPDPAAPPGSERESAYARAGLAVMAAVDVLIAIWDGAPARGRGGTAEIVAAARAAGREVMVIPVTRAPVAP
jgi:hypothetical protein